jgi:glyoxylase-like metal-dependent hydrolase (beta-lactamase superfamily II)
VPLQLPGGAPGETAFYWNENGGVIILGDAIINLEATGLILLPDKYCTNPKHLAQSLEKLTSLPVKTLTFAHGLPITEQAAGRLSSLVKAS